MTGSGTQQDPYVIYTPSDFALIDNDLDAYYVLGNDIDFNGEEIEVALYYPFTGNFDGRGYTLKNITLTSDNFVYGIFGYCEGASISNVNVKNLIATCPYDYADYIGFIAYANNLSHLSNINVEIEVIKNHVWWATGGLIGYLHQNTPLEISNINVVAKIHNPIEFVGGVIGYINQYKQESFIYMHDISSKVYFDNTIQLTQYISKIGGFVGDAILSHAKFERISSEVYFDALASEDVGGFAGRIYIINDNIYSDPTVEISKCCSTGNMTVKQSQSYTGAIGGFIGTLYIADKNVEQYSAIIKESYAKTNINIEFKQGSYIYAVGAFTGENYWSSTPLPKVRYENCYATGDVKTANGDSVGGFTGDISTEDGRIEFENCYSKGLVTGEVNVGGFAGALEKDDSLPIIESSDSPPFANGYITMENGSIQSWNSNIGSHLIAINDQNYNTYIETDDNNAIEEFVIHNVCPTLLGAQPYSVDYELFFNGAGINHYYILLRPYILYSLSNAIVVTTNLWSGVNLSGYTIQITSGPGSGQVRTITSNTENMIYVSQDWTVLPSASSAFEIINYASYIPPYLSSSSNSVTFRFSLWQPNELVGKRIKVTSGTGMGQARTITSNSYDTIYIDNPWTTNPDATSWFEIDDSPINIDIYINNNLITTLAYDGSDIKSVSLNGTSYSEYLQLKMVAHGGQGIKKIRMYEITAKAYYYCNFTETGAFATSCYWDKDTSGQTTSALGEGKTTNEMKTQSTYVGWDFTNIWKFGSCGYPVLINWRKCDVVQSQIKRMMGYKQFIQNTILGG